MNIQEAKDLFAYDTWANTLIFDAAASLSEEALRRNVGTSHKSVFGTLTHLIGAEEVWLGRWRGEDKKLPSVEAFDSLPALRDYWQNLRLERDAFVSSLGDAGLREELEITTSTGKTYRHRYDEMIRHLVNHSSYHRGQVVTLLRQLGGAPPATDLIRYYRERSST